MKFLCFKHYGWHQWALPFCLYIGPCDFGRSYLVGIGILCYQLTWEWDVKRCGIKKEEWPG